MDQDKLIPNSSLNLKNINFKVKIEIHLGDKNSNVLELDVPGSATNLEDPFIIDNEEGKFIEFVANTSVILKTKSRIKIDKKLNNVNENDPLKDGENQKICQDEYEDASITVELLKDDDKVENNGVVNYIEEELYSGDLEMNDQDQICNEIPVADEDANAEEESYNIDQQINSQLENEMSIDENDESLIEELFSDDQGTNSQLDDEIPIEEDKESSDEADSITSSFAREILKGDIEIKSGTHMAKQVFGKPNGVHRKKGMLPRYCEICDKTFARPGRLIKHLEVHRKNANKVYQCLECDEIFTGIQNHEHRSCRAIKNPNKSTEKRFECSICNKKFRTKVILNNHLTLHSEVKNFSCDYCPKTFYTNGSLVRHMHKHIGVKCRFCNELFRAGNILETHERTHTGEKPFICELCGKSFALAYALKYHIRRHNNDKRYECEICAKKFYTNSNLRKHSKTHV